LARERSSIEDDLDQLRTEIAALRNFPPLSPQFVTWLGNLLLLVEGRFGVSSDEMRQLRAISPELPSEFYDSVATRLESLGLNEQLSNALFLSLHKDAPQKIFKQRLDEYDDFIAAIIYGLRSRR
jgi:hypothetical protein